MGDERIQVCVLCLYSFFFWTASEIDSKKLKPKLRRAGWGQGECKCGYYMYIPSASEPPLTKLHGGRWNNYLHMEGEWEGTEKGVYSTPSLFSSISSISKTSNWKMYESK